MASLKVKEIFCLIYSGLLFVSGVLLISFSVVQLYKILYHFTFVPSGTIGPFIVIFLLGILHLFLTWLGIKGPTREHNFHIILFMIFTATLLIGEFAIGVWSMILWDEIEVESIDLMTESFNELIKLDYDKKAWDKVQSQFKCCGLTGISNYDQKSDYPRSCFKNQDVNGTLATPFEDGCKLSLIKYVKGILTEGAVIGFLCAVFQGLGVFAFYSFFKTLREERTESIARRIAAQRETLSADQNSRKSQNNTPSHGQTPPTNPPNSAATASTPTTPTTTAA